MFKFKSVKRGQNPNWAHKHFLRPVSRPCTKMKYSKEDECAVILTAGINCCPRSLVVSLVLSLASAATHKGNLGPGSTVDFQWTTLIKMLADQSKFKKCLLSSKQSPSHGDKGRGRGGNYIKLWRSERRAHGSKQTGVKHDACMSVQLAIRVPCGPVISSLCKHT